MANPRKLKVAVSHIQEYGSGTYRVVMEAEDAPPAFRAGQFLHLTIDEYDGGFWPESRVFSIASLPENGTIEIVYSIKGRYTRRMADSLAVGKNIWLKMPFGDFVIDRHVVPGQGAVLIAGGTGISPFVPFIRQRLASAAKDGPVKLYYGVQRIANIIWPELWNDCVGSGSVDANIQIENEDPGRHNEGEAPRTRGRLDIETIYNDSLSINDPVFFVSGPPGMIAVFKQRLANRGVDESRIISDDWE